MTQAGKTFRIFVSSTFSDLVAERNALQERVFPRLRALAAARGCRFQVIDLRWGVSSEASLDQQAMNICLGEIERCQKTTPRPNFIVLLGDRYGWRPLPFEIPREEFQKILTVVATNEKAWLERWYWEDKNADPVVYVLHPRQPELSPIPTTAFEKLIRAPDLTPEQRDAQRKILEEWYRPSDSTEPVAPQYFGETSPHRVVYTLQPLIDQDSEARKSRRSRAAQIVESHFWNDVETSLHSILDKATESFPSEARFKYVASATEQEIVKGVLRVPDAHEHVFCFFRKIKDLPQDASAEDFVDLDANDKPDDDAHAKLDELKHKLRDALSGNIKDYEAAWIDNTVTLNHIPRLCLGVWHSLRRTILAEIEHPHDLVPAEEVVVHIRPDAALDEEGLAHHRFAEERLRFFVGRMAMLATIAGYLTDNARRSLAIVGAGGTGKSALMAKAIQQTQASYPKAEIVYRFIGATPGSSDGRSLLDGLCREISRRYGKSDADVPTDYRDLVPELGKRMQLANADRPLILFLDSLDQLSTSQDARSLIWLPNELPEHVSVIASTRPEDTLKALRSKQAHEKELGGLSRQEGDDLLGQWLASVHRALREAQRQEVLDKFEQSQGNPLYLKLAFEESRLWVSGSGQPPEQLAPGVSGIIEKNMIERLAEEGNHGRVLVSHALGYLAASRYGLAEDELVDLLSRDLQVYRWFLGSSFHVPADLIQWAARYRRGHPTQPDPADGPSRMDEERAALEWLGAIRTGPDKLEGFLTEVLPKADGPRLPVVLWSRLSFDLAPYLTERMVDGSPLMTFYHRELGDVASAVFLAQEKDQPYHARLAVYFRSKADPTGDRSWTGGYPHGLSELPYHLIRAAKYDQVYETLTDFTFLEHKAAEVGVQERKDAQRNVVRTYTGVLQLQEDLQRALDAMPGEGGSETGSGRAPLIVTAVDSGAGLTVYCPVCNKISPVKQDTLNTTITCPQEGCEARLKLNPFVIHRS